MMNGVARWRRWPLIALLGFVAMPGCIAAADRLADLRWLAGHWVADGNGYAEEVWLEPRAGSMSGSFRWIFADGNQVLEYLVIAEEHDGIRLRFKHFEPDYVPWEKAGPNTYRLSTLVVTDTGGRALFEHEGEARNVPRSMQYVRSGDRLTFTGIADAADAPLRLEFTLRTD